jgi:hypothetical protein
MRVERVSRGLKEGGGWGKNGVPVTRRCQPRREAKTVGRERRGKGMVNRTWEAERESGRIQQKTGQRGRKRDGRTGLHGFTFAEGVREV